VSRRIITDPFADAAGYRRLVFEVLSRLPNTTRVEVQARISAPSRPRLSGDEMQAIDAEMRALVLSGEPLPDETCLPPWATYRPVAPRRTLVVM
jgi:hypothetical protein